MLLIYCGYSLRKICMVFLITLSTVVSAQGISRLPQTHGGIVIDAFDATRSKPSAEFRRLPMANIPNQSGQISLLMAGETIPHNDHRTLNVAPRKSDLAAIRQQSKFVSRSGPVLEFSTVNGASFRFVDARSPGTQSTEADSVAFIYSGPVAGTSFHKVDLHDAHDASGSYLLSAERPIAIFVQPTTDLVSISPQGDRVAIVTDGLNNPFAISVASIQNGAYKIEVVCQAELSVLTKQVVPMFKGWHRPPYVGLDFTILYSSSIQEKTPVYEAFGLRLKRQGATWEIQASHPTLLPQQVGLVPGQAERGQIQRSHPTLLPQQVGLSCWAM